MRQAQGPAQGRSTSAPADPGQRGCRPGKAGRWYTARNTGPRSRYSRTRSWDCRKSPCNWYRAARKHCRRRSAWQASGCGSSRPGRKTRAGYRYILSDLPCRDLRIRSNRPPRRNHNSRGACRCRRRPGPAGDRRKEGKRLRRGERPWPKAPAPAGKRGGHSRTEGRPAARDTAAAYRHAGGRSVSYRSPRHRRTDFVRRIRNDYITQRR